MKFMEKFKFLKSRKKLKWLCIDVICFALAMFILFICNGIINKLEDQNLARRWSEKNNFSQVSVFFSNFAQRTEDDMESFEHGLDDFLIEEAIVADSSDVPTRLWVDSYSSTGTISVKSEYAELSADVYGIGGDFFLFHPIKLLSGNYFTGNDLNNDYIILDEELAWQLFGSSDIAGMTVYIKDVPFLVEGVVEKPKGKMIKSAGLDGPCAFVSYKTLQSLDETALIRNFEVLMPDPIDKFAVNYVTEKFGSDKYNIEIVESSDRFSIKNRWKTLSDFFVRSMNGKAIIYPYWENLARGYEDIISLLNLVAAILLLFSIIITIIFIFTYWRHKKWTFKGIFKYIINKGMIKISKGR